MKNLTRSGLWICLVLGCTSGAMSPGSDDASSDSKESGSGGSSTGGALGSGGATASGGAVGSGGATASGGNGAGGTASGGSGGKGSGGVASGGSGGNGAGGTASGGNGGRGSGGAASGGSGGKGPGGAPGTGGTNGTGGATATGGAGGGAPGGRGGGAGGGGGGGSPYLPCPTTAGTACAVLPLGDSITEGCCTAPEGGYRIELFRQAVTNGKNVTFVGSLMNGPTSVANRTFPMRHEGHGGYTISGGGNGGIAGTITDSAISTYHPNIVLLMIGTNDINDNIDIANAPSRLGKLIDEIIADAPTALVVVATIIPISAPNGDQRAQAYNAALPGLVNARASAGKHVVLVDNYAAFAKDQNYQTTLKADGLHPNTAGYVVLGQSFYGAIGALLPAGP